MAKNKKTRFFHVLYSVKTWVFDQSQRAQGLFYVIISDIIISSLSSLPWKKNHKQVYNINSRLELWFWSLFKGFTAIWYRDISVKYFTTTAHQQKEKNWKKLQWYVNQTVHQCQPFAWPNEAASACFQTYRKPNKSQNKGEFETIAILERNGCDSYKKTPLYTIL